MSESPHARTYVVCGAPMQRWTHALKDEEEFSWLYLGKDFRTFESIKGSLARKGMLINSGEILNRIALEIRDEFINFDRRLEVDPWNLLWLSTDLAERNPYGSQFFFNCCAYLTFSQVRASLKGTLLVFVEDWFLGWFIARGLTTQGSHSRFLTNHVGLDHLPFRIQRVVQGLARVRKSLRSRIRFMRNCSWWKRQAATQEALPPIDVCLVTWGDSGTFPVGAPKHHDTYFGNLPGRLFYKGIKVGYLIIPVEWVAPRDSILRNIRQSGESVLLPDACLSWKDIFSIVIGSFGRPFRVVSRFVVQDADLTEFIIEDYRREKASARQCWAMRFRYVGRFLRDRGIRVSAVVHPYENQPWEKALRLGIRAFSPHTRVVGYQHATVARLWLGTFLSRKDLAHGQLPDTVIVPGPKWKEIFCAHGYPQSTLAVGPALRFEHLFRAPVRGSRGRATVLVASSIDSFDTLELLSKTREAFINTPELKVLLKFHPKLGKGTVLEEILRDVFGSGDPSELPPHFHITQQPIADVLPGVHVVLHNGTSVALEAATLGIPVVLVASDLRLDQNTVAYWEQGVVSARTPEEIRDVSLSFVKEDEADAKRRHEQALYALREFFLPVQDETLQVFYDLSRDGATREKT